MVSTRSVRYKFCEGERVLCYEPDPTKVKVLYDSKVLEVIESKDKRGRRTVEYLIHFQGWNSSWDRCVSEDFVLKDTEENRQLQRDLAEKSQLQLGAYLYRRERKKGGSSSSTATGGGTAKRARHDFSDDASSSSTQLEADGDGETVDTDSSSTLGSQPQSPWPIAQSGRAHIPLPAPLRDRLTFDYHLVAKRGKLSRLPASPTVAEILESFVKWFARAGAWHPPRPRYDPPQKPDILDVSCRLNLVREVADGLRVYFDFVLRGHLLYKQELNQYHKLIGQHIDKQEKEAKAQFKKETSAISESTRDASFVEQDMKSPKVPEYSHLPPDPDGEKNAEQEVPQNINQGEIQTKEQSDRGTSKNVSSAKESVRKLKALTAKIKEVQSATRNANIARSVGSSASSASEFRAQPILVNAPAVTTRTPLSLLLEKVTKWEIISHDNPEHLPCRIYGAIHLARLFVKLPDFLSTTQMPDFKLKLILKHVDMFIQYLDEHSEWFGESYYTADSELHPH